MKTIDKKNVTSNITEFLMYADFDKEVFNISGYLVNEHYDFYIEFDSVREMCNSLENIFDYYKYPMATHNDRVFSKKNAVVNNDLQFEFKEYDEKLFKDKKPIFEFRVEFRYNSTWQGTINFLEEGRRIRFNSELNFVNILL